ncbi:MAG TPA: prepilin-type N-terminal cleavage/methylation domain-containing protein [Gemmatimonadaceae bacterium]|nr:prepilin-type N-terminal cleavage/methylation domain-containing protein [Gemmatimonadaceae bacterium]
MLRRRPCPAPRGFTLVELLVTIVVAGVVLGLLTLTGLRQQRLLADLLDDASLSGQLRDAAALLPIQLRAVSAAGGDLRDARDTALEVRGTIASGVVCDIANNSLILAAPTPGSETYASYATSIQPGDTAWLYVTGALADAWLPYAVTSVASANAGPCAARGPRLGADVAGRTRTAIALDSAPGALAIGRPLRVTRAVRLSLYRSSDGSWSLGERDWNPSTQRFNAIQPLAGPFLAASSAGLAFTYLDTNHAAMTTPLVDSRAPAAIAFTLRGETRSAVRALGSSSRQGRRLDSARVVVLLRNRR